MERKIAHIALIIDDYDKALDFYIKKLKFTLVEDTHLNESKRWILISPKESCGSCLLLAKATDDEQRSRIGNQTGGRVFLFLQTNDFDTDYQNLIQQNIKIIRERSVEEYGKVAVFEDLYGNKWDLIEQATR